MVYDVIISGAGPVGLFLGCELALAKCSVLLLEKERNPQSPLKQIPFGVRGLSTPTIESLDRRGLLQELQVPQKLKSPHMTKGPQTRRQVGHFAGIGFHDTEVDASRWPYRLPGAPPTSLVAEMQELEDVLARRAESLGVTLRRGVATISLQQTDDGVSIQTDDATYEGRWLVGCDGSRSVVRKCAGFEFAGTEPELTGYTTRVELADPEQLGTGRHFTERGMYLQSQPGYVVLQEFDGGARHQSGEPLTLEHVQAAMRRVSGLDVTVTKLHAGTTWTDRARQATTYRKGRILLAGDAAHIHAPLGGQGLNLGLGDAMNLGWKLAAVIHAAAPTALLDTYEAERHPPGVQVLNWSRAQVVVMRPDPAARALNAILRDVLDTRDGATYFAGRVWGVHNRYSLGGDHPLIGYSSPNFELSDGTLLNAHMREGRWTLLDFESRRALKSWAKDAGGRLQYIAGPARETLASTSLLIRPDGYIALACHGEPDVQAIQRIFAAGAP